MCFKTLASVLLDVYVIAVTVINTEYYNKVNQVLAKDL